VRRRNGRGKEGKETGRRQVSEAYAGVDGVSHPPSISVYAPE